MFPKKRRGKNHPPLEGRGDRKKKAAPAVGKDIRPVPSPSLLLRSPYSLLVLVLVQGEADAEGEEDCDDDEPPQPASDDDGVAHGDTREKAPAVHYPEEDGGEREEDHDGQHDECQCEVELNQPG